jgi:hypothetical protein
MPREGWVEREIEAYWFSNEHLKKRFGELHARLGGKIRSALPAACQDWAPTKATKSRMAKAEVFARYDRVSFEREPPDAIGKNRSLPSVRIPSTPITKCGLLMHSSGPA